MPNKNPRFILTYFIILFVSTFLFIGCNNTQNNIPELLETIKNHSIKGDYACSWDGVHEWDPIKNRGSYRFYTIDGEIYVLGADTYDGLMLYHYNRAEADFHEIRQIHSATTYYEMIPNYDPILFSFKNKYYAMYYTDNFDGGLNYVNSELRILKASYLTKDAHWNLLPTMPWKSTYKIYRGVINADDFLYMIYDSYMENGKLLHHRKDIYIDKAVIDTSGKLKVLDTYKLTNVMGKNAYHPYAATSFIHPDGKRRILISYSAEKTSDKENKGGGVISFTPPDQNHTFSYRHIHTSENYAFSIRAIHGTIKGQRDNPPGGAENRDRIQILYNHFTDGHFDGLHWIGDKGHFYYRTYSIKDGNDYRLLAKGEIKLGDDDLYPDEWDRMNLDTAYLLKPVSLPDDTDPDVGYAFDQRIWMFYTDGHGTIHGKGFISDKWHYLEDKDGIMESDDLENDPDASGEKPYDDSIEKTWVLFGIMEGSPPCAINWDKWNSTHHNNTTFPSRVSYRESDSNSYTITLKSSASWYIAVSASGEVAKGNTKFSQKYEKEYSSKKETTASKDLTFVLDSVSQTQGTKLYIVPTVKRIAYATFPWWQEDNFKKTYASNQPLNYRFIISADRIKAVHIPLSDPLFGGIDTAHVNDPDLSVWRVDAPGRDKIHDNREAAVSIPISWSNGDTGDTSSFKVTETNTLSSMNENSIAISATSKLPSVFSIEGGVSFSWSFKSTVTTSSSTEMEVSYEDLILDNVGPMISGIDTTAYWFQDHEKIKNLWYLDFVEPGQYPWYIGYIVEGVELKP
jgi:hypothetical protein